ncbi:MAG: Polymorphic membrane protein [Candidatus Woesebacteria bacterium GW2011_GWB1_43_14]|uniref:Polymorphic membrane protein n=1 Tax=Candidatus Woesebacteria bacterium GW2011_GWB1_43_14 TaxID=1618578 RepID=A0A0G1GEK6_9BACT|nr:MAG: Polymorphic membrane protein [Candidatus Woesebacteria bacterium GW2011_GWA1_39_11b]KKS77523.1 MAG: Type I signal peptidase [Candidatus Woesebacteria bacterium GW2011_GWC1_42_9]KKS97298.1 MAG: Polymorphic membrane protein [Candidatus Woesebacteria bacterium GW2011_GWB1_43_14]
MNTKDFIKISISSVKIFVAVAVIFMVSVNGFLFSQAYYTVSVTAHGSVVAGEWNWWAPVLVSPSDGTLAGINSPWTVNPLMDWEDVAWGSSITYIYQSSHSNAVNLDGSFVSPAYTSGALALSQIPAPGTPDGVYYWHVKACDAILGCGDWSEMWVLTVDRTVQEANPGDVAINEIMWMGSSKSYADEWIELRNMTGNGIILKNWVIENAGDSGTPNIIIPSGIIPANSFYLISNYSAANASSALNIEGNMITTGIELVNVGEQLTLKDATGKAIDQTPTGPWSEGTNATLKQSMERNLVPGDGMQGINWHTCIAIGCNDITYWDIEGNNYGTPRAANLSENDPSFVELLAPEVVFVPDSSPSPTPEPVAVTDLIIDALPPLPTIEPTPAPSPTPEATASPSPEQTATSEPTPEPLPTPPLTSPLPSNE